MRYNPHVILLALDTCDSRGSVAVFRDDEVLKVLPHECAEDYSSWVLPKANEALSASGLQFSDVELFAVASGPGSFTGVRIGLATVKAWSEAYRRPIAGVSRLEAIASQAAIGGGFVAAFVDAQRGQVFGGLYRKHPTGLSLVGQELVVSPEDFVKGIKERTEGEPVSWISTDPEKIALQNIWGKHASSGENIVESTKVLAPVIGRLGRQRSLQGRLTDALGLDAEYVRRSYVETDSKGSL